MTSHVAETRPRANDMGPCFRCGARATARVELSGATFTSVCGACVGVLPVTRVVRQVEDKP